MEMADGQERLNLLVVIASTRPVRVGLPIGEWVTGVARSEPGWAVTVADLKEIDLPLMNEPKHPRLREYEFDHTKRWSELVDAQDAFVFVFPEYNHSMIAPLRNALDYLVQEWSYKPVGLVSYGGMSGGIRAAAQVKLAAVSMRMMPISEGVIVFGAGQHVRDGVFEADESVQRSAGSMFTELHRWARAMKLLRTGEI